MSTTPKNTNYPYKWCVETDPVIRAERERLFADYSSERNVLCHEDMVVPSKFQDIAEKMYNIEVREDDVWIITYPKCGTTWTQVGELQRVEHILGYYYSMMIIAGIFLAFTFFREKRQKGTFLPRKTRKNRQKIYFLYYHQT